MKDQKQVSVGLVQHRCNKDVQHNLDKAVQGIRAAAGKGAQIICLQELFQSIYFCFEESPEYFQLAEKIPGQTTELFQALSKELGVVIIASLFEKRTEGLYHNTTVVNDADGSYLGKYRKHHIPDDPGYSEKFYFTPGDGGYKVFNTRFANIGVLICWDQWFPEAARITALQGAELLFYPTAIGWDMNEAYESLNEEQFRAWQTIQQSHSIANGIPVISVNRTGEENNQRFWGSSFVTNGFGHILHQCSSEKEETAVVKVTLEDTVYYRTTWPFFRDRRVDTYKPITKRFIDPE
ncbi:MAG: acyltransferase [Bacteroidetes bacterium]|jgi:N-carbamoylputrescine amidase|nr:acyltransferase [Bacteroidota bacterium]